MRSSPRDVSLALLGAVMLTVVFTWPMAPRLHTSGRVDSSDARHGMWNLAWVAHALTTDPRNLFDANIFYPHKHALAYSESNLVGGLIALPAWLVTRDALTSFNWTVLCAFVLSAMATFALARCLTGSPGAAILAPVLFTWSPYMFSRLSHIQLLMTFGLAWTLLAFHRYLDRPGWGRAVWLGVVLAVTALACGYYGIFAGLALAWGFVWFGVPDRLRDPRYWLGGVLAAAVAMLIVAPFFAPYRQIHAAGFERTLDDARLFAVGWRSYLASAAMLHQWLLSWIGTWRTVLFPGLIVIALSVVTLVPLVREPVAPRVASRRVVGFYATGGALAVWMSFGPDAGLYRVLHDVLPVFTWIRAPGRFGVMAVLAMAVLASVAFAQLRRRWTGPWRTALTVVVFGCALAESWVGPIYLVDRSPVPPVYEALARLPRGPVAEFPYFIDSQDRHRHTEYMLASTGHWQPLLNGSSDFTPAEAFADGFWLARFPETEAWQVLERRRARYIVVHWGIYEPGTAPRGGVAWLLRHGLIRQILDRGGAGLYEIVRWPDD